MEIESPTIETVEAVWDLFFKKINFGLDLSSLNFVFRKRKIAGAKKRQN